MHHKYYPQGTELTDSLLITVARHKMESGEWKAEDTFEVLRPLTIDLPQFGLKKGDFISSFTEPLPVGSCKRF